MKKKYLTPEVEVVSFALSDAITDDKDTEIGIGSQIIPGEDEDW